MSNHPNQTTPPESPRDHPEAEPAADSSPPPGVPGFQKVADFQQLQEIFSKPMKMRFALEGQYYEMTLRRLPAAETEAINRVWSPDTNTSTEVLPPFDKETSRYLTEDTAYQTKLADLKQIAMALYVFRGTPALREQKPDLTDREKIREFVCGFLPGALIDQIYWHLVAGGLSGSRRLSELVNFTGEPE